MTAMDAVEPEVWVITLPQPATWVCVRPVLPTASAPLAVLRGGIITAHNVAAAAAAAARGTEAMSF